MAQIRRGFEPLSASPFRRNGRKRAVFSTHYAGRLWSAPIWISTARRRRAAALTCEPEPPRHQYYQQRQQARAIGRPRRVEAEQADEDLVISSLTVAEIRRVILEKPAEKSAGSWSVGFPAPRACKRCSPAECSPSTRRPASSGREGWPTGRRKGGHGAP